VDGAGGPLSVVVAGANVNDFKLLRETIESAVVARPACRQHLCLDKGYDNAFGHLEARINGYTPHIRRIGTEKLDDHGEKTLPARRWVVERTFAWLSKCRTLLVRHEKKAANYIGLIQLDCVLLWFRRYYRLTVLG
jgi:putative transposase